MPYPHLNIYELNTVYGGPEEGGWWYDTGTPVASVPLPESATDAEVAAAVAALRKVFTNTYKRSSVLYPDRGYDYTVAVEDGPAAAWPSERPHYE